MNTFIFQGGAENLEWFKMSNWARAQLDYFWTVQKTATVGNVAFIYLTAPLSRIVGIIEIVGDPFVNTPNRFANGFMNDKICAHVEHRESFDENLDLLSAANLKRLFGKDWGWTRYPRGGTRIPAEILPPFMELVGHVRHLTRISRIINEVKQ